MAIFKNSILNESIERKYAIESRLLQYYVLCELVWAFVNGLISIIIRMPVGTIMVYCGLCIGLIIFMCVGYLIHKETLFARLYFAFILIYNPVMWYFAGGARASASILFIAELVSFVMCLTGVRQKIYIILSMLSTSVIQNVVRRLPDPEYPMTQRQLIMGGAILGISTSIMIALLLLKQKKEYAKERDMAVESEKELEKSNSLQKNFLANMSHEIRSPLGIVMGFNNLICDTDDVELIHEYSKDISQAGTTLLTVINDILDYSKIESGKLAIIEDNYSLNSLIKEIKTDIALKCEEKGLKFVVRVEDTIPDRLLGDVIRIKQCLINILSNAVKYTDKGAVIFNVQHIEATEEGKHKIKFIVKDTGKGISEEALPNIFSAFQRLDEGMNRGIEGTGLGMAITKNLLDEMNGTIEVESKLGEGSTFTVVLWQQEGIEEENAQLIEEVDNLNDIKVMVVDDTALNLTLIRKLLEKEGAIVNTFDSGKACLEEVSKNKYDIILLDHMMPEMNGVEVFEEMKLRGGINEDTPIVMLTANAMAGAMKEYMDMGFDGYLSKPIPPLELKETIIRLLAKDSEDIGD